MEPYSYPKSASKDERAVFCNMISRLLWQKYYGDTSKIIEEFKPFREGMESTIRNVYELADNTVPLMGLFDLITYGADNFGLSEGEYNSAINRCVSSCNDYYL